MRIPLLATAALMMVPLSVYALENPRPTTKPTTNPLAQINDELLSKHLMQLTGPEDEATRATRRIDACMARASERLAQENDPGRTTQQIQDQIIKDIDELIELSRKQGDRPPSTKPSTKPTEGVAKPTETIGVKPENQNSNKPGPPKIGTGAHNSAAYSARASGSDNSTSSGDIRETATGWGRISNRIRDDIMQSVGDDILDKYYKLTTDYYRAIATRATERR
jgi:hypothetical protein